MIRSLAPSLENVAFKVPRAHVLARLGCPPDVEPSGRLRRQIDKAIAWLQEHAEPRVEHRSYAMTAEDTLVRVECGTTLNSARLARSLKVCHTLHVFLATLGRRVDDFIDRTMQHRPDVGVVVDAVASVAAETMVDQVTHDLSENLPPGQALSLPFSPGYCDWAVDEQRKIFSLLPECPAGTVLSEDAMMSPRKSVSGILGAGSKEQMADTVNPCTSCARKECDHRRSPYRRTD